MFVEAGLEDVKICLSNGLNENTIQSLKQQGAVMDSIGLGDNIVFPDYIRSLCAESNLLMLFSQLSCFYYFVNYKNQ